MLDDGAAVPQKNQGSAQAVRFDDDVLYQIHVATTWRRGGHPAISSGSRPVQEWKTILQSYLGVINDVGDAART
jgi:hypothetical protein